jgi:hypothetical protein
VLSAEAMNKLLSKSILGYIIQIHSLQTEQTATVQHLSAEIDKLIESFAEVFSEPTELPPSRACDHSIILTPGEQPPNLRPYRVPHMQKNSMEDIITKLLQAGQIQASLGPFSSPVVMVRKRDGSWRLCIDYRLLNSITVKNKFPMPIIEDLLDEIYGATIFSKLDVRSGYHQIRMNTADIPKTGEFYSTFYSS